MINHNYRQKYLKYKTKYLELQIKLNNQSGGNLKTAENSFFNKIFTNKEKIYSLLQSDIYLSKKLKDNNLTLPLDIGTKLEVLKENKELKQIFSIIVNSVDNKFVDEYIKMYLNGKLGKPNSIENVCYYIYAQNELKKLRVNNQYLKIEIPATFDSLTDLNDFIIKNKFNLDLIDDKNKSKQKIIKEEGKDDVEIILSTPNVTIYHPTTEAGSKFYGSGTKWCTAGTNKNMFSDFNNKGPIYIIIPKSGSTEKFQIQFESGQLVYEKNRSTSISYVSKLLNDKEFDKWFNDKIINLTDGHLKINGWVPIFTEEYSILIKKLTVIYDHVEPFLNHLYKLTNLEELDFGSSFDESLTTSLDKLVNLQQLTFGDFFNNENEPLDSSLDKLVNLKQLTFGYDFNQYLANSLDKLVNLQQLTFGWKFNNGNQPLDSSLDKLVNLKQLTFDSVFDQPFANSLDKLVNLQQLNLWYYNRPLANSLDKLTNLQELTLFGFNQPLGSSLDKLTNLQKLTFGEEFDQPLTNSLDNLTNLQKLTFSWNFNQPFANSLNNLTNLQELTVASTYKHSLPQKPNLKIIKL
jgi:hypothetical protein